MNADRGRRLPLNVRLVGTYLVILGIGGLTTSIVGSWIVSTTIMRQAKETAGHDLAAARTVYGRQLADLRRTVDLTAGAVTEWGPVRQRDSTEVRRYLGEIRAAGPFDFLTLTDAAGRVVFREPGGGGVGDDASGIAVVRAALGGTAAASTEILATVQLERERPELAARARLRMIDTPQAKRTDRRESDAGLVLLAAAPIRDADGAVTGTLYAGILLNRRHDIVDGIWRLLYTGEEYRGRSIGSVTIFLRDVRIATTIYMQPDVRAVGTRVSSVVHDAVLVRGETWRDRAFVVNEWYVSAYEPIRSYDGEVVGILYVGLLEDAYRAIRDRVILSFFGIATIGFVLIIAVTYVMVRNITRPIREMVAATKDITAGRFDRDVLTAGQGEIAELASSFNLMQCSLRQMKDDLEDWGRTLEEKVRDRTEELLKMEQRVAQSERLASLGKLAAGVAHEINNPLGGILALTALAVESLPEEHPERANLEEVVRQTERCRDIVRGLLDFARQSEVHVEPVDVHHILDHTLNLIAKQSMFLNVRAVKRYASDCPAVLADRSQLQQVFLNILVNAVQAMDERGTITISTHCTSGMVAIAVADTGRGIPQDQLHRVFDPFFTTKAGGLGTGLGLSIAYGIVTQHGGTITVESAVGAGTVITVSLPIVETLSGGDSTPVTHG